MSAYGDRLPNNATRERYDTAVTQAGRALAEARRERDELAMTGGPEAVAQAAWTPGGTTREQIAETYRQLQAHSKNSGEKNDAA